MLFNLICIDLGFIVSVFSAKDFRRAATTAERAISAIYFVVAILGIINSLHSLGFLK